MGRLLPAHKCLRGKNGCQPAPGFGNNGVPFRHQGGCSNKDNPKFQPHVWLVGPG